MSKRFLLIIILLVTLPFLTWLLWPLSSAEWAISFDQAAFAEKKAFLAEKEIKNDSSRPNIILITVDDLGMADVSAYGEGQIQTPHMDKFGEAGVIFENAYVTSPVCAPSRASLITGRYQQRFGFEFTIHETYLTNRLQYFGFNYFVDSYPWKARWTSEVPDQDAIDQQGLPVSEITLAELLKKKDYHTGIIGKWHLGWTENHQPLAFGFDEQYGFMTSHSLYAPEGSPGITDQKNEADWTDDFIWSGQRNGPNAIYRNGKIIEENGYLTDRITEESIEFIESNKTKPFFLWISYNAPHTPLQAPDAYMAKFSHIQDPIKRIYAAMINSLDDNIGVLMAYLEAQGLTKNTLIFLISDNGGAEYTLTTDNGRYAGGKNTEFEGGVKVPMMMRWDSVIPAGIRYFPMVSALDIFPTSAAAADLESLKSRPIDGTNLLPFLTSSHPSNPHEFLFWQRGISKAVRSNEWKLIMNDETGEDLLYKLTDSPFENPEMSAQYPDIVASLKKAHQDWEKTHAKPLWPPVVYYYTEKDGVEYFFEQ